MARIEIDPNYTAPTFPRATEGTDVFKKEDVQALAAAMSAHNHTTGKGVVLGAGAIPPGTITSAMILDGTITNVDLADGAVTNPKIGDSQVSSAKIAAGAVGQGQLASPCILTQHIIDGQVTTAKIADSQITGAKIAPSAVGPGQIANNAVLTQHIADGQVTAAKLASGIAGPSAIAVGATSNPTTTSTTMADLPDMTVTLTTTGGILLCWLDASIRADTLLAGVGLQLNVDGADVAPQTTAQAAVANQYQHLAVVLRVSGLAAGSHTVKGRWNVSAGTATAMWTYRTLLVQEVRA